MDLKPAKDGYPIKLVRDRTAEIINTSGEPGDLFYGGTKGDIMRWLKLKLAEELGEYLVDGGIDELGDVLAVIEALAIQHGSSIYSLMERVQGDPRGGFHDAVMMYGRHEEFDK